MHETCVACALGSSGDAAPYIGRQRIIGRQSLRFRFRAGPPRMYCLVRDAGGRAPPPAASLRERRAFHSSDGFTGCGWRSSHRKPSLFPRLILRNKRSEVGLSAGPSLGAGRLHGLTKPVDNDSSRADCITKHLESIPGMPRL